MLKRALLLLVFWALVPGCTVPTAQPAMSLDNPANPDAAEAPLPSEAHPRPIGMNDGNRPATDPSNALQNGMKGMDMNAATQPTPMLPGAPGNGAQP